MKESKCTNFCVTVNGKTEKIEGPVAWVYETEMSKKEIKKAAKKQKKEFDKRYDSQPVIRESPIAQCVRELENFKTKTEWIYEFNHDHTGLLPGVPFIMNNQLFKVIETEGTKIRAKKIMKTKTKKHKVEIPEDYEFVTNEVCANGDELRVSKVYHKKPIKKQLPKTWEELGRVHGYFINASSEIIEHKTLAVNHARNMWPTKELAEASVSLSQLCQLRDVYNDGWVPDWKDECQTKYSITYYKESIELGAYTTLSFVLAFKSSELQNEFLNNFKSLIIEAKPLL